MKSAAENLEGTAKLLGSKGRMEGEKDLDDLVGSVNALLLNCTHLECIPMFLA